MDVFNDGVGQGVGGWSVTLCMTTNWIAGTSLTISNGSRASFIISSD